LIALHLLLLLPMAAAIFLYVRQRRLYMEQIAELTAKCDAYQEGEARNKLMVDEAPVACYLIDKDFQAIDCNRETLKFFNLDSTQEGLEKFRTIFFEHHGDEIKWYFDEALQSGYARFEWGLKNRYDNLVPVEIIFARCSYQNEDIIAAYINDVSAEADVLYEKENSQAKSRFLARMSHEIRTPISAVLGIAEIQLHNLTLSPEVKLAFNNIYTSGNTLLSIVNDILDLSKIEAGKMELHKNPYGVAELVSNVTLLNRVYREDKEIDFNIRIDENVPARLYGDELRIKQILNNFLSNAFKYTDKGTVSLSMYALTSENDNPDEINLLITVRDTGRGMNKEQKEILFDDYTRFHEKDPNIVGGTGLGTSIAFSLLEMMNAVFEVESEPGRGTTISILMPQIKVGKELLGKKTANSLRKQDEDARIAEKRLDFIPDAMPHGKILVVDDMPTNLFVAKGLMGLFNLQIDTCESGRACINLIKSGHTYDIIFMDHHMPGMSGIETTQRLRDMGYTAPVVALTANALVGQAEEFMNSGFDEFLSKPISTVRLNEILIKFIGAEKKPALLSVEEDDGEMKMPELDDFYLLPEVQTEIRADFAGSHKNAIADLTNALSQNDTKEAMLIVHSLKGIASLMNEKALTEAALLIELNIKKGEAPQDIALENLETQFNEVMAKVVSLL
jgi:signal transduction histidine kinase/DNA-binding NarL/FixJ family response regulator